MKYIVKLCRSDDIKSFIETWHYSKSINGVKNKYCFKMLDNNEIIGAAIMAKLGMANTWKKYGEKEEDVIELRRLCCIDDTPPNIESYFIGKIINWLKKYTKVLVVVSYADQHYNHTGIIYKASNFEYLGQTSPNKMIEWNGKLWHDKTIRTYYNGILKPYAQKLKDALDKGDAKYVTTDFKYIYIYKINRKIDPRQTFIF